MNNYLVYWKPDTVRAFEPGLAMNHIWGQSLNRVEPGDVVWAVSILAGRLTLVERIPVGEVVSREETIARVGPIDVWNADYHVFTPGETPVPVARIDIQSLALALRFDGDPDRLPPDFDGRNLQSMRTLTLASADLLEDAWGDGPRLERRLSRSADDIRRSLATFNREALEHQEDAKVILRQTTYWVYEPAYDRFGPGKFVGFADMTFDRYRRADQIPGARFDGHDTRVAIEKTLDIEFVNRPELAERLKAWAERLFGDGAFGNADESKWRFIVLAPADVLDDDADGFPEGRASYARHLRRERSAELRARKKDAAIRATGRLACEACGFDFKARYGELGDGFIECHHTIPVSTMPPGAVTRLEDVVLLCSNCHRMIHRNRDGLGIEALMARIVE